MVELAESVSEDTAPVAPQQPDPYDGVALGVECAWPIAQLD